MEDLIIKYPCPICNGTGKVMIGDPPVEQQCGHCNGDGSTEEAVIIDSGDILDTILEDIAGVFPNDQKQDLRDKLNDIEDKLGDILEILQES